MFNDQHLIQKPVEMWIEVKVLSEIELVWSSECPFILLIHTFTCHRCWLSINWTHHVITCYTNDNVLFQTDDIVQTCQMSHLLVVAWMQEQPRQATWCFGRITPPLATPTRPSITNITRTMVFSISERWVIVIFTNWFRHPFVGVMVSLSFILNGLSINPPDQYQRFIMIFYHQIEFLICLGIFANQPECKKRVNQPIISWIQVDLSSPKIEFSCARTLWGLDWAIQNIKLLLGLS